MVGERDTLRLAAGSRHLDFKSWNESVGSWNCETALGFKSDYFQSAKKEAKRKA